MNEQYRGASRRWATGAAVLTCGCAWACINDTNPPAPSPTPTTDEPPVTVDVEVPASNMKLWISWGDHLMPSAFMAAGEKFNAIMFFTGAMGLNATGGSPTIDRTWMQDDIPVGAGDFDQQMETFFSVPQSFESLDETLFVDETQLWLNAYGGNSDKIIGPADLAWLGDDAVLTKLKSMGWDGISVDVENINLGSDPTAAAGAITALFDAFTKNGLLGAINTSTFGDTQALESCTPDCDPGLGGSGLTPFLTQLGKYEFDVWNPQLYDGSGVTFVTSAGELWNCPNALLWTGPKLIAPLIRADIGNTFVGADNPGSASGGWVFSGQGTARTGLAGFGLWPEDSTVTSASPAPAATPACEP